VTARFPPDDYLRRCRARGCPRTIALLLLAASDGKVMTSAASTAQHTTEIRIFI
jgi:hypothetical protein